MEGAAAGLGDRVDHNRSFRILGGKVRSEYFDFRNHVWVRVHWGGRPGSARIEAVLSVLGDINPLPIDQDRAETSRVRTNRETVDADDLPVESRPVYRVVRRESRTRHKLDEFSGVAADQGEVLQIFGTDHGRLLAGVNHSYVLRGHHDFHLLGGRGLSENK